MVSLLQRLLTPHCVFRFDLALPLCGTLMLVLRCFNQRKQGAHAVDQYMLVQVQYALLQVTNLNVGWQSVLVIANIHVAFRNDIGNYVGSHAGRGVGGRARLIVRHEVVGVDVLDPWHLWVKPIPDLNRDEGQRLRHCQSMGVRGSTRACQT